jgi:hypothetical protein
LTHAKGFSITLVLASSWSDGDSITGGAGAGANLLDNGENITADEGTAEVDGRAAAAAQFRARAVKNKYLGARDGLRYFHNSNTFNRR